MDFACLFPYTQESYDICSLKRYMQSDSLPGFDLLYVFELRESNFLAALFDFFQGGRLYVDHQSDEFDFCLRRQF